VTSASRKPTQSCKAPECERKALARGLCSLHYQRQSRGKPLSDPPPKRCGVPDCGRRAKALDLCPAHYNRHRRGV